MDIPIKERWMFPFAFAPVFVIDGWKLKADIWTETDFVIRKCFSG